MGIVSIVLLLLVPSQIRVPAFDTGAPSPRIIPTVVFIGMLICSTVLIIQSLVFKKDDIFFFDIKKELPAIILLAMICGFAFVIVQFGFIPAILIFFPAVLFFMGERKPFIYLFTLAAGFLVFLLFTRVFTVPLPSITWFGG